MRRHTCAGNHTPTSKMARNKIGQKREKRGTQGKAEMGKQKWNVTENQGEVMGKEVKRVLSKIDGKAQLKAGMKEKRDIICDKREQMDLRHASKTGKVGKKWYDAVGPHAGASATVISTVKIWLIFWNIEERRHSVWQTKTHIYIHTFLLLTVRIEQRKTRKKILVGSEKGDLGCDSRASTWSV